VISARTGEAVAIALAAWAGVVALFALMRPVEGRHAMTMRLSLTLLRYDEGLELLEAHSRRSETWWEDADPIERHQIDNAISMWDLAAWYVSTRRVDKRTVLDVFRWRIVDVWERAYPYIQHRRVAAPTLWSSLTELYMDAHDADSHSPGREERRREERRRRSVSPEYIPEPASFAVHVGKRAWRVSPASVDLRATESVKLREAVPEPATIDLREPEHEAVVVDLREPSATEAATADLRARIREAVAVDLRPPARASAAPPAEASTASSPTGDTTAPNGDTSAGPEQPSAARPTAEFSETSSGPEPAPAAEPPLDPWAEALRMAGPVMPPPGRRSRPDERLQRLRTLLTHLDEPMDVDRPRAEDEPAPSDSQTAEDDPLPMVTPPRRGCDFEHVVDLVEVASSLRGTVAG
jgi:hypothetical protein